jgi:hypothetical protein
VGGGLTRLILVLEGRDSIVLNAEESQIVLDGFLQIRKAAVRWSGHLEAGAQIAVFDPKLVSAIRLYLEETPQS